MENELNKKAGVLKSPASSCSSGKNFSLHYESQHFHYENHKPGFHPRTPSSNSTTSSSLQSFMSANSAMTPPAKRFHFYATQQQQQQQKHNPHKVRNPFEAALAERWHLPTIASPSLFQRPTTPQLSSTQLEWTIDDFSSLKPVHVEPHETQFHDSPDPDYEAKAQSAISSFFKEHQIVPSPVNCPLRQQRIILAEINSNTPIAKPGRRIRDIGTQTALTLPPQLPADLEAALQPYFQPQLSCGYDHEGKRISYTHREYAEMNFNCSGGAAGGHNVSMRRKLFDIHNIIVLDENRKIQQQLEQQQPHQLQTPTTPKPLSQQPCKAIMRKLSDSFDDKSPEDLSPINSISEYYSPNGVTPSQKKKNSLDFFDHINDDDIKIMQKRRNSLFRSPNAAELSPIFLSPRYRGESVGGGRSRRKSPQFESAKDFQTPGKFSERAQLARRRLGHTNAIGDDENNDDDDANIEIDSTKFTPDRSSSPLHSFHSSASGRASAHSGGSWGCAAGGGGSASTFATDSFHRRFTKRLVVTSAGKSLTKRSEQSRIVQQQIDNLDATELNNDCTATMEDYDDDAAMLLISSSQLSTQNSNLSSSSINSHCDTPTGKKRSASRKNLSQSFSANWPATSSDEDEMAGGGSGRGSTTAEITKENETKKLVNEIIDKKLLPAILKATANVDEPSNENQITNTDASIPHSQCSQQPHFYRTDSGFNEMTTSSSTSSALLLLSQQDDETSREAVFASKGFGSEQEKFSKYIDEDANVNMDISMSTRCSTPTQRQQQQTAATATVPTGKKTKASFGF